MFIKVLLDILYPRQCPFCGNLCGGGICGTCAQKLIYITEPRCKRCGKPVRYDEQEYCRDCSQHARHFDAGRSLWLHQGEVSSALYRFKYHNQKGDAEIYGCELAGNFGRLIEKWEIGQIIPVPLHTRRRRQRGFNQAEEVARALGKNVGIPVSTKVVCRSRDTTPQKELSHKERSHNLHNAFEVSSKEQLNANVLVVDDIYTTGSTVNEMARVLKESGVRKVYFLTISIGQGI